MSLMRTVHVQRTASSAQMPYAAHRKARGRVARDTSVAQCGYALDVHMRQGGYVHALSHGIAHGESAQGSSGATGSAHHMTAALPLAPPIRVQLRIQGVQRHKRTDVAWRMRIRPIQRYMRTDIARRTHIPQYSARTYG